MPRLSPLAQLMIAPLLPLAASAAPAGPISELKRMSLDALLNVEVTSVSRTEEVLRDAAAAITIVDSDMIRRSGATSLPETLRLVPGVHVARQNSNVWAVSVRGFSSVSSEKLLVLMDTRSVYTPLFSGVLWDVQDYLLEDIERVEVIRGPGAALWGSNAVNGVINVTTKSARATQGSYIEAGGGTFERAFAAARYGGVTDGDVYFRVYGRYFDRDSTRNAISSSEDDWHVGRAGFRADWSRGTEDEFTLQGDVYDGEIGQLDPAIAVTGRPGPVAPLQVEVGGANVLGRWRRHREDGSDTQVRVYYDRTRRDDPTFIDSLDTIDVDLQHRFRSTSRHEVIVGANYRFTADRNRGKVIFALDPEDSDDQVVSGFIQDQISLGEQVRLTLGTKLEHNDFSGSEIQPNVRLAWDYGAGLLWTAISRAARVPTRLERDIAIDVTDPSGNPVVKILGNDEFDSERVTAYEAGYRWQPIPRVSLDVAAYYNRYADLASLEFGDPFVQGSTGQTIIPIESQNLSDGRAQGVELQVDWAPRDAWRFTATYSFTDLRIVASGQDLNRGVFFEGATPKHQFGLRSSLDIAPNLELDVDWRHSSEIRSIPVIASGEGLDAYSEVDLRLGWRPTVDWELSLVGQNLLHDFHEEFGSPEARGDLSRAVYVKAAWRR